jgi:ATP/maltotriose-dependent transcriptional regulator MalT
VGSYEAALEPLAELRRIAKHTSMKPLLASAAFASGALSAEQGDYEGARRCFEDAVSLYERVSAPFDSARLRMALARALSSLGRHADSGREATLALQAFRRLGAPKEAEVAAAFLRSLGAAITLHEPAENPAGLSTREVEVLELIAAGRSNQEIASALFLSVRTVERHISTIYEKIGAHGKAARAAATAYALNHGLTPAG